MSHWAIRGRDILHFHILETCCVANVTVTHE